MMLILELDDFHQTNHRLDLLDMLYQLNTAFKATLFTIPTKISYMWLEEVTNKRPWMQIAVHGWAHETPRECQSWGREAMEMLLKRVYPPFVHIFKAPGWNLSDACYDVLTEHGWVLADHPKNAERRVPWVNKGLKVYDLMEYGLSALHGHIQNVCHNGLEECFYIIADRVKRETEFNFVGDLFK